MQQNGIDHLYWSIVVSYLFYFPFISLSTCIIKDVTFSLLFGGQLGSQASLNMVFSWYHFWIKCGNCFSSDQWRPPARELAVFWVKCTIRVNIAVKFFWLYWQQLLIFTINTIIQPSSDVIIMMRQRSRVACSRCPLEFLGSSNIRNRQNSGDCQVWMLQYVDRDGVWNQRRFGLRRG